MDTTDQQAVTVAQIDVDARQRFYDECRAGMEDDDLALLDRHFARHRLASVSSASAEARYLIPRLLGHADYDEDFSDGLRQHLRDAARLLAASPEPVPATNQAGEVDGANWRVVLNTARQPVKTREDMRTALNIIESVADRALATQPATSQEGEEDRLTGEGAWDILVNVDDRTSPEEYPNMCLITRDELIDFLSRAAPLSRAPSTDLRKLGQAIGAEIDRQCSIGAGTCGTADDGSGLFEVNASLDLNGFAHAMSLAATPTPPTLSEDLREALEPFADAAADYDYADGQPAFEDYPDASSLPEINDLTIGNLRAARAALAQVKPS